MKSVESSHQCKSVIQTMYDIVKAHGGELKVETKEGKGNNIYHSITKNKSIQVMPMLRIKRLFRASIVIIISCICNLSGSAQSVHVHDSLKRILMNKDLPDSVRTDVLGWMTYTYRATSPDSAVIYGEQAYQLATKINSISRQINTAGFLSFAYFDSGNLPKALDIALNAYKLAKENNAEKYASAAVTCIGYIYLKLNNYHKALHFFKIQALIGGPGGVFAKEHLAEVYLAMNRFDSALYYANESLSDYQRRKSEGLDIYAVLGDIALKQGKITKAIEFYRKGLLNANLASSIRGIAEFEIKISRCYKKIGQLDSCIYYAKKALAESEEYSHKQNMLDATSILSEVYEIKDPKQALNYYKTATKLNEELIGPSNIKTIQNIISLSEEKDRKLEETKKEYQREFKQYALIFSFLILVIFAFGQLRSNARKQRDNSLLLVQRDEIQSALLKLKSTQSQLIQSEKMASLGELTAGIAHEIQNPLNFVNNFSEVTNELVDEMKTELATGNQQLATEIANDIKDNLTKINHHGQRAADIVKGMLQHSRTSTGQKELTDVNALCDEYLRLSYHGLRAKDKSFNAKFETDFDLSLPKINVIPQDIGRVILNLINNAFYAVNEKAKQGIAGYEPTVTVTTKCSPLPGRGAGGEAIITVKDNGSGIPDKIKAKIFQPFFTTKPTGQGTGLGLSLSYDIVKAHGGNIQVITQVGAGTEFVLDIPMQL